VLYTRGVQAVAGCPKVASSLATFGQREGQDFMKVLPTFRGCPASCLLCTAWHGPLWPRTNFVMCIWPSSVAWLHTLALL